MLEEKKSSLTPQGNFGSTITDCHWRPDLDYLLSLPKKRFLETMASILGSSKPWLVVSRQCLRATILIALFEPVHRFLRNLSLLSLHPPFVGLASLYLGFLVEPEFPLPKQNIKILLFTPINNRFSLGYRVFLVLFLFLVSGLFVFLSIMIIRNSIVEAAAAVQEIDDDAIDQA